MKKVTLVGLGSVVILGIGFAMLRSNAQKNLTRLVNEHLVPQVAKTLGVEVSVEAASASLLGGSAALNKIMIGNPEGFAGDHLLAIEQTELRMDRGALFADGVTEIEHLQAQDVDLRIVRMPDRRVNLQVVGAHGATKSRAGSTGATGTTPAADDGSAAEGQSKLLLMRSGHFAGRVQYTDYDLGPDGFELILRSVLTINNLSTPGGGSGSPAEIRLTGALADDETRCVTDLSGHLAPVEDVHTLTFTLKGRINNVDLDAVRPLLHKIDVDCDVLDLDIDLSCEGGVFDPEQSMIKLVMKEFRFTGDASMTFPDGRDTLATLTVPIPLGGTLTAPQPGDAGKAALLAMSNAVGIDLQALGDGLMEHVSRDRDKATGTKGSDAGQRKKPFGDLDIGKFFRRQGTDATDEEEPAADAADGETETGKALRTLLPRRKKSDEPDRFHGIPEE